ncbi:het domain containing protein [Ophiostoma piceae UAMH 11346]|uniref:Het domain containing protein n=1 Tax=Ophiostoma piceae (strain UAMH 11346) TaxID=1262450 RepID=S3BSS8_OPHP1|nr:het domain containing protein [Ophiostoma piceae UAMH 11346]
MTIADVALQLPQSDIRVVLGARHVGVGAFLSAIKMFDLLTVRLGNRPDLGDPLRTPELVLVLRVPGSFKSYLGEEMLPTMDGYRIGCAEIDHCLGSATNLRLARHWLDGCMKSHTSCGATTRPPRLPTRVVDVMASSPRLVHSKEVNANGPDTGCGHYVALSHCWGGPIKTLLLSTTMADFLEALPSAADIPANFRDAMAITRALGIRYLWIDSLCIVQDSVLDWRRESKQMAEVYGRATVSLMAMASAASYTGILVGANNIGSRTSNDVDDVIVPFEVDSPHGAASHIANFKVDLIHQDNECLRILSEKSPLSVRGWCLQELIFSYRVLYFGNDQIYWKCPEGGHKSAEGLPDGNMYINHRHPQIYMDLYTDAGSDERSHDGLPADEENDADKILSSFHDFVVSYTQRQLSFGTDKFPAVSSFALQVYNALEKLRRADPVMKENVYIAGIWSGDFRRGLLFCPDGMHSPHVTREAEAEYRAPSWSWAITDAPLTILSPPKVSDKPTSSLNLELVSWDTVLRDPNNAFGAVDYAHLIVKGQICSLRSRNVPFIGAYTWDRGAEEGTAWFDDAPTGIKRTTTAGLRRMCI